jgi:hypothetical protein
MDRERKVDMIRIERQEQVFERESVLGRDTESVFPTELHQDAVLDAEKMKEALGSVKFVTETEVEEIKLKEKDRNGEEIASAKPLAQILTEKKQLKDDEFQEQWKLMKQGKNRPLDADELDFLDSVEAKKRKAEDSRRVEEETELLEFQLAREQALQTRSSSLQPPPKAKQTPLHHPSKKSKKAASSSMMIRVKPKAKVSPAVQAKPKLTEPEPAALEKKPAGLSLVADYGSDSD